MAYKRNLAIVVVLTTVAIGLYYFLRNYDTSLRYQIYTSDSVHGMVVTSPVEFDGVTVGEVRQIDFIKPGLVKIVLSIQPSIPITKGTRAAIITRGVASRGFTGYVYILLSDKGQDDSPLMPQPGQKYPVIPTIPPEGGTIDLALDALKGNMDDMVKIIESILDKNTQNSFKRLIFNMERISDMLLQNNNRINTLILNTEKASHQFNSFIKSGTRTMNILETQVLPEVYQALANANTLTQTATGLVNTIERDPSVIIRGSTPPIPGPGE